MTGTALRRVTTVDPGHTRRSTSVDQVLVLLRRAVADCGYTLDALEASMGKGRAYIHNVLQGEKPLTYAFIVALPDDIQARFESLRAESFGYIVVEPVSGEDAVRDLVRGMVGILTSRTPR